MEAEIFIENKGMLYAPVIADGVTWELERQGTPGKLVFDVVKDEVIDFQEGNPVILKADGKSLFYGFVFTKKRDKNGVITVTAYDQLRYLKNKDSIIFKDKTAAGMLEDIAKRYSLQLGTVEDTGLVFASEFRENETLFDMVQYALDKTLQETGKLYVLYDDFGKLTLCNVESLRLDVLLDSQTAENLDYESSIDSGTYNVIKLAYSNDETGTLEIYGAESKAQTEEWGVLQYFESIQDPANGQAKADALLSLYNRKTRKLSVKGAFGDTRVRAGSAIAVDLNLGDIVAQTYLMVEKVTHSFSGGRHSMDLHLIGGSFVV